MRAGPPPDADGILPVWSHPLAERPRSTISTEKILSPGSARDDRLKKLRIYASHDVRWTWIVDPDARSVECFEAVEGLPRQTLVAQEGETPALPPFDLPIAIDALWGAARAAAAR